MLSSLGADVASLIRLRNSTARQTDSSKSFLRKQKLVSPLEMLACLDISSTSDILTLLTLVFFFASQCNDDDDERRDYCNGPPN